MLDAKGIAAWPGKKIDGDYHPASWHMLDVGAVADCLIGKRPVTGSASWDQAIARTRGPRTECRSTASRRFSQTSAR
ncbi:MAG: hypothetical protein F4213_16200 [Boseongicola sp. SB0677_bin_26]|nr:hypothetical protein [Boseongicola sp. SB0677_bin_26]